MLVEEEVSANLESVPEMADGGVVSEFNVGLGNEGVDVDLGGVTGSAIWYKILFVILGGMLALAILFKIIGGCVRVSRSCVSGDELKKFFIEDIKNWFKLGAILRKPNLQYDDDAADDDTDDYEGRETAYKLAVTTLYDIRNGIAISFVKLKDLFRPKEEAWLLKMEENNMSFGFPDSNRGRIN